MSILLPADFDWGVLLSELTISDVLIFLAAPATLIFLLGYGLLTKWWRDWLGIIIMAAATGFAGMTFLVVWAMIFGQRVDEGARIIVGLLAVFGAWGKLIIWAIERRNGRRSRLARQGREATMKINNTVAVPNAIPDIWYKGKRVLRTAFTTILSFAVTFFGGVLTLNTFAPQILEELGRVLPEGWITWLGAALASLVLFASVFTRIIAIPGVNQFLTKFGLGTAPKSALVPAAADHGVVTAFEVKPDPKVEDGRPSGVG